MLKLALQQMAQHHRASAAGMVVPDQSACVECGICSFNCPAAIDVRAHARDGSPIADPRCLTCGECIARCPRGALRLELSSTLLPLEEWR